MNDPLIKELLNFDKKQILTFSYKSECYEREVLELEVFYRNKGIHNLAHVKMDYSELFSWGSERHDIGYVIFPVSEIPRVIAELEKIHLIATNAVSEV